jgi:hypothetical protein
LRSGAHRHEEVRYWQANLLFRRASEQAGHHVPCTSPVRGSAKFI